MATQILLRHPQTGLIKKAYYGFSWTTFIFGCFPALFRGDLLIFFLWAIGAILLGAFTAGSGAWGLGLVMAFKYNKMHGQKLIEKGYVPAGSEAENALAAAAFGIAYAPTAIAKQAA